MTERTSLDKDAPEPAGDAKPEPPLCENCGRRHEYPDLTSKERGFWFLTVLRNAGLLVVPALPAMVGVKMLITPTADVRLNDAQRAAVNSGFELTGERATTVRRVVVELDHPSLWDRLTAAGPSLLLAGILLFLAYALWRIEVNTTAGPHQRPFTEKDERYLGRSARWLWWAWWVFVAVEAFGPMPLHLGNRVWAGELSSGSLIVMGLALLVGVFARVYRKGRRAYSELEKIV